MVTYHFYLFPIERNVFDIIWNQTRTKGIILSDAGIGKSGKDNISLERFFVIF